MQLKYCIIIIWTVQLLYTICIDLTALQTTYDHYHSDKISPQTLLHHTLKLYNIENWWRKQHIQRQVLCINNLIAEWKLSDGDSHHLVACSVNDFMLTWSSSGKDTPQYVNVRNHNATYKCTLWCWGTFSIWKKKNMKWTTMTKSTDWYAVGRAMNTSDTQHLAVTCNINHHL